MNLESFSGPGSTPSRRRFWDKITAAVIASQKLAGKNVSVAEHQGKGTLINVTRGRPSVGVCCTTDTITIVFSDIVNCEGVTGDLNGAFVLTETFPGSGQWEGAGANYFNGPDEDTTDIVVSCAPTELGIDYRGVGSNVLFYSFLVDPAPPSFTDLPNDITDCSSTFGHNGTASICCGDPPNQCCTNCDFLFPPLSDGMGNCYASEQCDGFHDAVSCDSLWLTKTEYCVGEAVDCAEVCIVQTIDPETCEIVTVEGSEEACSECVNGTVQTLSHQVFLCPELSPPP